MTRRRARFFSTGPRGIVSKSLLPIFLLAVIVFFVSFFLLPTLITTRYDRGSYLSAATSTPLESPAPAAFVVTHRSTPTPLKAIYMTSWVAGDKVWREKLVKLITDTELNAVVIDIKDYTGRISFVVSDPALVAVGASENRIPDIKEFIGSLHDKGIYVIGRVSVFQDPFLVKKHPELAVKRASDKAVWKDYKGITWLDAGAPGVWQYIVSLGKEAWSYGFDELNFDYVRFPSDGNMADIYYPYSEGRVKADVMKNFFSYLSRELRPTGATLSVDLFGMTTTNEDDLNIGQLLENALPYFDYVAPMVYPSHYPPHFMGFANPADKPYEVIKYSMDHAVARAELASSTPDKLRPWLQDFNLGADYTAAMVRTEIKAVYDSGLASWMLWNAANRYTAAALNAEGQDEATTTSLQ